MCWVFGGAKHDLQLVIILDATLPIKTVGISDRHYRMDFDPVVNGSPLLCPTSSTRGMVVPAVPPLGGIAAVAAVREGRGRG